MINDDKSLFLRKHPSWLEWKFVRYEAMERYGNLFFTSLLSDEKYPLIHPPSTYHPLSSRYVLENK